MRRKIKKRKQNACREGLKRHLEYLMSYGGPDGELGASMRYLSQRYAMPYAELKGILTDIGSESP
jgi:Mn-containing catalase